MTDNTRYEEFKVNGSKIKEEFRDAAEQVASELRHIFEQVKREGEVRRVIIKNKDGKVLVDLPALTAGAIGAASLIIAPIVTILVGIGAIATDLTVIIEKEVKGDPVS